MARKLFTHAKILIWQAFQRIAFLHHRNNYTTFLTMSDNNKTRKIDKDFALTDSSVNEYGFRLLTSGYVLEEFQRNPIGYRMHCREDGVICRWEDLRVEGDVVYGKPVINLANPKGEQTVDEVENGFLSFASVGGIVLLEYIIEAHPLNENETILTGTKWYNKETSLVDMPGNRSLLPELYDANEQKIQLADLTSQFKNSDIMKQIQLPITPALMALLPSLADNQNPDANAVFAAVTDLSSQVTTLTAERNKLKTEKETAETSLKNLQDETSNKDVTDQIAAAKTAKLINEATAARLADTYKGKPKELKEFLADLNPTPFRSIVPDLKGGENVDDEYKGKGWDDLKKEGKLPNLKSQNPDLYKKLYKEKFGNEPTIR